MGKIREITVGDLTLTVGCRKITERGAFTFTCGDKSKAGNYMYCSSCKLNKKILDGERAKIILDVLVGEGVK